MAAGPMERNTMTSFVSFARRQNHDSSVDSICTKCYQTIASAENESGLAALEQSHHCSPYGEFNQDWTTSNKPRAGARAPVSQ